MRWKHAGALRSRQVSLHVARARASQPTSTEAAFQILPLRATLVETKRIPFFVSRYCRVTHVTFAGSEHARVVTMSGQPPQGPPAATGQQQPQGHQLLKADDVLKLQSLSEDLKQKYRPIIHQLWNTVTTKPAGTPEHSQARSKLQEFSQKLIAQERVSHPFTPPRLPRPSR